MATELPRKLQGLLEAVSRGEAGAADELLPHVYDHLRALAGNLMRSERKGHTLRATALVREAQDAVDESHHGVVETRDALPQVPVRLGRRERQPPCAPYPGGAAALTVVRGH